MKTIHERNRNELRNLKETKREKKQKRNTQNWTNRNMKVNRNETETSETRIESCHEATFTTDVMLRLASQALQKQAQH